MLTRTLRPGYLVSLKTSVDGGVHYYRKDLDLTVPSIGENVSRWETTKVVDNPEEFDLASQVRNKCRSLIGAPCVNTAFGLVCPTASESDLSAAVDQARELVDTFNAAAETCRVRVYVIRGRIADNDSEALSALAREVRDLFTEMQNGIANVDVKAVRDAASRALKLGAMLDDDAQERINAAVEQAREAARELVKRVGKAGEDATTVLQQINVDAIERARTAFLDFEEGSAEAVPVPGRAVDLTSETATPAPTSAPEIEV